MRVFLVNHEEMVYQNLELEGAEEILLELSKEEAQTLGELLLYVAEHGTYEIDGTPMDGGFFDNDFGGTVMIRVPQEGTSIAD